MSVYYPACPHCWHQPKVNEEPGGIGTSSLASLITFKGGNLDKNSICNKCKWNYNLEVLCKHCKPQQPCYKHYATIYNGSLNSKLSSEMHKIYMRNSPYKQNWSERPASIGAWYAKQVTSYTSAINFARRFTRNQEAIFALNSLENGCQHDASIFLTGFYNICIQYFSGGDCISLAMNSFYHTLINCKTH
jgi:hypothetical protein